MGNMITWEGVMKGALSMPGVKVDRAAFLQSTFSPYGDATQLLDSKPTELFSPDLIDKLANDVIRSHTKKVTAISAVAGIPGGLAMLATVPADLVQYYWHYLVVAQKLAYLYGWPDLRDENNNLGEEAQSLLTIFVGVGLGVNGATAIIKELAEQAAKTLGKKISQMALAKSAWNPVVKKIAAFIGIKITQDSVGKATGKIIPFVGAAISGGLTYATFRPTAKRLKKQIADIAMTNK